MITAWSFDELAHIAHSDELQIAAGRSDGTLARSVPVWVVRVESRVYVRTWYRRDTGWFGNAVDSRRARIITRPLGPIDVAVEDVGDDPKLRAALDAEYRIKYARYGDVTVDRMVTDDAAATTLRLIRAG